MEKSLSFISGAISARRNEQLKERKAYSKISRAQDVLALYNVHASSQFIPVDGERC